MRGLAEHTQSSLCLSEVEASFRARKLFLDVVFSEQRGARTDGAGRRPQAIGCHGRSSHGATCAGSRRGRTRASFRQKRAK